MSGHSVGAAVPAAGSTDDAADLLEWSGLKGPERPVFVGGCSRSGTTLLGAMLGVGAEAVTVPEATFKWDLLAAPGVVVDRERGVVDLRRAAEYLPGDRLFRLWRVPLPEDAPRFVTYGSLLRYLVAVHARDQGKAAARVWVDHTPGNIRVALTLRAAFPEARFVNLVRDGRAVAASVIPLDWGPNDAREAGLYWSTQVAAGLAAERSLGADRVRTVRYEDLVREPAATLRGLCGALDIAYSDSMVGSRDYRVNTYEADQQRLVAQPPDPARIAAWREQLSPGQIRDFERVTGELLGYLGYDLHLGATAGRPGKWEHARSMAVSAGRRVLLNKLRFRRRRRRAGS